MDTLIFPVLAIIGFLTASYFDFRTREIPPLLSYSLILLGLGGHAVLSFSASSVLPFLQSALLCVMCFFFAFSLYRLGVWAGGDVKLFAALGALLPMFNNLPMFPFLVLAAALLAFFPFAIVYVSIHFMRQKKLRSHVKDEFILWLRRAFMTPFYLVASFFICLLVGVHWIIVLPLSAVLFKAKMYAVPVVAFFSLWAVYDDYVFFLPYLIYIFLLSALLFIGLASFKALQEHVLREEIKIDNLEEGMIPVVTSGMKKLGLSGLARGLTNDEINKLKTKRVKTVVIRKSMPFTPVLTMGLIILVLLCA